MTFEEKRMKEYDLYVPLHSNKGVPIPKVKLTNLKKRLIERFGGLTQFPQAHDGFWKIGAVTFRDRIIILRVLSTKDTNASDRFWSQVKRTLKKHWKQQDVLIVVTQVATI